MEIATRHATLYGVASYPPNSGIPDLPAAETNTIRLTRALERWGFKAKLVDDPVQDEFARRMRRAETRVTDRDLYLLYLTGHSFLGSRGPTDVYFAPSDVDHLYQIEDRGIHIERILRHLADVRAAVKILIYDSCFSGGATKLGEALRMAPGDTSAAILASSSLAQTSHVSGDLESGEPLSAYTEELLRVLDAFEREDRESIELHEVANRLKAAMDARPEPQRPVHLFSGRTDVVLCLRKPDDTPPRKTEILPVHLGAGRMSAGAEDVPDLGDLPVDLPATTSPTRYVGKFGRRFRRVVDEESVIRTLDARGRVTMTETISRHTVEEWGGSHPSPNASPPRGHGPHSLPRPPDRHPDVD